MRETPRRREIRRLLQRREREGLTFKELSRVCGLSSSTLTGWAWRFRKEEENREASPPDEGPSFVEIAVPSTADDARVEIVLRSGRRLLLSQAVDPAWVGRLLAVVDPC